MKYFFDFSNHTDSYVFLEINTSKNSNHTISYVCLEIHTSKAWEKNSDVWDSEKIGWNLFYRGQISVCYLFDYPVILDEFAPNFFFSFSRTAHQNTINHIFFSKIRGEMNLQIHPAIILKYAKRSPHFHEHWKRDRSTIIHKSEMQAV